MLVVLALALALGPTPSVTAIQADGLAIDGVLSEAAWGTAQPATGFVQFEPTEGAPASEPTEVRVLRTPSGIVVGARMTAVPGEVRTALSRRDDEGTADAFTVAFDSYNDARTAYFFGVTAAGVQVDGILEGGDDDDSWDAVWTSAVRVTPEGWTVEMHIPYSQLRFSDASPSWGVQFRRSIPARGEEVFWSPVSRSAADSEFVRQFGRLEGVDGIRPRPVLQATPYTLAGGSRAESDLTPGAAVYAPEGNVGADVKVGLSSNIILDATINPDFGQVDADPAQLNLSAFEVIFQERRPFFTEGTQIFDQRVGGRDGALLYTRRIGAASPIIAATKLTGRTPRGLSFGALGAVTGDDFEPDRGYLATRVKQEFAGQSYVGAGLTGFTGDGVDALAAAADWEIRTLGGAWQLEGEVTGTARSAAGDEQYGAASYVGFDKVEGYVLPGFGLRAYTEGFQVNDVGRFRQTDIARVTAGMRVLWNQGEAIGPFRRISTGGFLNQTLTLSDGANQGLRLFSFNEFETRAFQEIDINVEGQIGGVDVFETRGLGPVRRLGGIAGRVGFESDSRRQFQWEVDIQGGIDDEGGSEVGTSLELSWVATDRVSLDLEGGIGRGSNIRAWASNETFVLDGTTLRVGAFDDEPSAFAAPDLVDYGASPALLDGLVPVAEPLQVPGLGYYAPVFGSRDTRQVDLTARAQVILAPTLSVQFYGQLFAARGRYRDYALLAGPDDLRPLDGFPKRQDFSSASFNSNAVLRWEYRPGSTLFVVWSQSRSDALFENAPLASLGDSPFETGTTSQLGDTFGVFPRDVVLVKLNYLLMR